jgi:class 3 adenylate cyclase
LVPSKKKQDLSDRFRNFTTISETSAPEDVVELMSAFLERMVQVVQQMGEWSINSPVME